MRIGADLQRGVFWVVKALIRCLRCGPQVLGSLFRPCEIPTSAAGIRECLAEIHTEMASAISPSCRARDAVHRTLTHRHIPRIKRRTRHLPLRYPRYQRRLVLDPASEPCSLVWTCDSRVHSICRSVHSDQRAKLALLTGTWNSHPP